MSNMIFIQCRRNLKFSSKLYANNEQSFSIFKKSRCFSTIDFAEFINLRKREGLQRQLSQHDKQKLKDYRKMEDEYVENVLTQKTPDFMKWAFYITIIVMFGLHTVKVFSRRVQGMGHNLIRKTQLELDESPLTNNVKITLDVADIPTMIKGRWMKDQAKIFGLDRPGWDFNEDGTATLKLRVVLESTNNKKSAPREGSITVQGHVSGYTTPVRHNSGTPGTVDTILEYMVVTFCMLSLLYLTRMLSWASLKPLFKGDNFKIVRASFPFSNLARHLSITKYISYVFVMPLIVGWLYLYTSIFSRIPTFVMTEEKMAAHFRMPYENLDVEVEEKTKVDHFFLDGVYMYLGHRLFGYGQDYRFEYCSRKLLWNIDTLILTINLDEGEKNVWIKRPTSKVTENQMEEKSKNDTEDEIGP